MGGGKFAGKAAEKRQMEEEIGKAMTAWDDFVRKSSEFSVQCADDFAP